MKTMSALAIKGRTAFWGLFLGALVGILLGRFLDVSPTVRADGEKKEGRRPFYEQAEAFREAAKQIAPAVVNITTIEKVAGPSPDDLYGWRPFYRHRQPKEGKRIR